MDRLDRTHTCLDEFLELCAPGAVCGIHEVGDFEVEDGREFSLTDREASFLWRAYDPEPGSVFVCKAFDRVDLVPHSAHIGAALRELFIFVPHPALEFAAQGGFEESSRDIEDVTKRFVVDDRDQHDLQAFTVGFFEPCCVHRLVLDIAPNGCSSGAVVVSAFKPLSIVREMGKVVRVKVDIPDDFTSPSSACVYILWRDADERDHE